MKSDPYDLERFVSAQQDVYVHALAELRAGRKQTHWMWFVFPQLAGLGHSEMARRYAIADQGEAIAYLNHPLLGPRLEECAVAMLQHTGRTAREVLGSPDDLKLRSCATLFAAVAPDRPVFGRLLETFFKATPDPQTLSRLRP